MHARTHTRVYMYAFLVQYIQTDLLPCTSILSVSVVFPFPFPLSLFELILHISRCRPIFTVVCSPYLFFFRSFQNVFVSHFINPCCYNIKFQMIPVFLFWCTYYLHMTSIKCCTLYSSEILVKIIKS